MKRKKHIYKFIPIILVLVFACSTEKNTWVSRNYHSLTSHYNIYFNGNESVKKGLAKIDESIKNDYTKILPIFKESLPSTGSMVKSDMDVAVEKASKVIKMHSITNKPKTKNRASARYRRLAKKEEYNRWVDDSYIMMGCAYLYQHDFIRAVSTFSYVIRRFKDEPIKYDAYVWLVRSYNEMESYGQALEIIEKLEGDEAFPNDLEGELAIVTADFHLKQNHHEEAIHYLDLGIKKIKGNKRKSRYSFILGQLYQETGNNVLAIEAYKNVVRRRPEYGMVFNARISSAKAFSGDGDVVELTRQLQKMLKKKRNDAYQDQIYYALANISLNEGDEAKAIELLRLSAAASIENVHQKALSCITVADLYFDKQEYMLSQNYYDTAMAVIDETYPDFANISIRYNSLTNLVNNLVTVETQDSLQRIANLDKEERESLVNSWIEKAEEEIRLLEEQEASGAYTGSRYRTGNRMSMSGGGSRGFYFYNPTTLSFGKKEFVRLWGERKLEDNWRRADKSTGNFDEEELNGEGDLLGELESEEELREEDPTKREYYLQDVPLNDSLMTISHRKIIESLYNAARIFKSEFNDYRRSVDSYLELNKRYPENAYLLSSYFELWDLYNALEMPDSSNYYKHLVLTDYPDSKYALYLNNPNYFIEEEARNDELVELFKEAFVAFKYREFGKALQFSNQVLSSDPIPSLIPKARLIKIISENRLKEKSVFADSLKNYLSEFGGDPASELAREVLALIDEPKVNYENKEELLEAGYINNIILNPELLPENDPAQDEFGGKFDYDEDLLHYFVVAFNVNADVDVNRLRFDIANYNIDNFTTLDFDIEIQQMGQNIQMLIVRSFEDKEQALIYFMSVIRKGEVFNEIGDNPYVNFVISSNNFREMNSDGSYVEYLKYFVRNYSRYTSDEFREEELESPEKLMARLKAEEEKLVDRGSYVVVAGEEESKTEEKEKVTEIPESKFNLSDASKHRVVLFVEDRNYNIALLMRDFRKFNSSNQYNSLSIAKEQLFNGQDAMIVSGFNHAFDAKSYLNEAIQNRTLFRTVGNRSYRNFVVSDANYGLIKTRDDVAEYLKFYVPAYVNRDIVKPIKEEPKQEALPVEDEINGDNEGAQPEVKSVSQTTVSTETDDSKEKVDPIANKEEEKTVIVQEEAVVADTLKKSEVDPVVDEPETTEIENEVASEDQTLEIDTIVETTQQISEETVATETEGIVVDKSISNDDAEKVVTTIDSVQTNESVTEAEEETIEEPVIEEPEEALPDYDGPYNYNSEIGHTMAFVVPKDGFNSALLEAAIRRLNTSKFKSSSLQIEKEGLDDFRQIIKIKTLSNKELAIEYYKAVMAESRTRMALRNTQYRVFLITDENFVILTENKDLTGYLEFFNLFYKVR